MVKKTQHGFSLLELVIAIAIIGVLAAIAIPSYNSYLIKSRRSDAKVSLVTLAQLQESWYVEHGNQYAALASLLPSTNLQGFNLTGINYFSKEGHYQLEVTLSNNNKSFLLKATPVDPQKKGEEGMGKQCYIFTLNEQGQKGVLESTATDCWS